MERRIQRITRVLSLLNKTQKKGKVYKSLEDYGNPVEKYSDELFRMKYRFSKSVFMEHILPILGEDLKSDHGFQLPVILQVLVALRFFACGAFQSVVGDTASISQPSVHRVVMKIAQRIGSLKSRFLKMPTESEAANIRSQFYAIASFPGVIGCIDGTHIRITSPGGENAEVFRCRKGYFSINVQAAAISDLQFINIVARWPGSTHDSRIFETSRLCSYFDDNLAVRGHLLGDSAYKLKKYLLTPVLRPQTESQKNYNRAQIKTRNVVERAFGILKRRFYSLGSILRTRLDNSLIIIVACFVLHNIGIQTKDTWLEEDNENEPIDLEADDELFEGDVDVVGADARNRIIQNYFS